MGSKALGTDFGNEGNTLSTAQLPLPKILLPLSKGGFLRTWALNFPASPHSRGVLLVLFIPRGTSLADPNQARFPGVLEDPNLGAALLFAAHLGDTALPGSASPSQTPPAPVQRGIPAHLGQLFIPGVPFQITAAPCSPGGPPWQIQSSPGLPRCWRTHIWEQLSRSRAGGWETEDGKDIPDQRKKRNPVSQPGRMGKGRL